MWGQIIPAEKLIAITPSDVANLAVPIRALYAGAAGDVKLVDMLGTTVTLVGLAAGVFHPVCAVKIFATDTTATDIVGVEQV